MRDSVITKKDGVFPEWPKPIQEKLINGVNMDTATIAPLALQAAWNWGASSPPVLRSC
jgi:hypothetical protein